VENGDGEGDTKNEEAGRKKEEGLIKAALEQTCVFLS
jgi:hypothetical protein